MYIPPLLGPSPPLRLFAAVRVRVSEGIEGRIAWKPSAETQPGHCSETQGVQEEKRDEELGPLVHRKVRAVANVDRETEFPQTEPGKRRPVVFPHPRVRGVFDAELWSPHKGPPYVAKGFQNRRGVTQRSARAKDHEVGERPGALCPIRVELALGVQIQACRPDPWRIPYRRP